MDRDVKLLDAIDAVCLNCIEDTLEDNSCCDKCPVRKLYDCISSKEGSEE